MDKQTTIDLFGEIDSDFGNDKTSEISLDNLILTNEGDDNFFEDITLNTADFKISNNELEIENDDNDNNILLDIDCEDEIVEHQTEAFVDNIELSIDGFKNAVSSIEDLDIIAELNDDIEALVNIENEMLLNVNESDNSHQEIVLDNDQLIDENNMDNEDTLKIDNIDLEETITIESPSRKKMVDTTKLNSNLGDFNIVMNQESDEIEITVQEELALVTKEEFGQVNIMVIGIGGCGCNIINRMFDQKNDQIKLIAIDTSEQTLENISSDYKLLIGEEEFGGHGSGGDTALAERAFDLAKPKITSILKDVDMVFLAGGIGRGTGSAGLVKVGKFARELGILTIGFVTLPRKREANVPILEKFYPLVCTAVDSTIIVENERVGQQAKHLPINAAMAVADAMLIDGIKGVFELVTKPGKINLDYADIKTAFSDQGSSVMGIGFGKGENPVVKAIENAFHSEVTDFDSIKTAKTIIFNITCARQTITIDDATKGTERLYSYGSGQNMNHLLFGYSYDESLGDEVKVTFIATGTTPAEYDFNGSLMSSTRIPQPTNETYKKFSEAEIFGAAIEPKKEEGNKLFPDFFKK